MDQLVSTCVFRGAPASVYKGAKGGGGAGQERRARRSPTPTDKWELHNLIVIGTCISHEESNSRILNDRVLS